MYGTAHRHQFGELTIPNHFCWASKTTLYTSSTSTSSSAPVHNRIRQVCDVAHATPAPEIVAPCSADGEFVAEVENASVMALRTNTFLLPDRKRRKIFPMLRIPEEGTDGLKDVDGTRDGNQGGGLASP